MSTTLVAVHTFPECRVVWMNLDSSTQELVLTFAARIWDAPEREVDDSSLESLRELETMALIVQEDGEWRFAIPQMLFYAQSISLIKSYSMDPLPASDLLRILEEVSCRGDLHSPRRYADWRTLVSFIIAQLVNEHGRFDVLELFVAQETSNQHFWLLQDMVCDSLAILDLTVRQLAVVMKAIAVRAQGDWAGGRVHSAAEYLGYLRPDFARKLIDHFRAGDGWESVGFLERLMTGVARASESHRDAVIAEAEVWLDSDQGGLCQAAVYLGWNLIANGRLQPEWLLSRVGSLISRSEEAITYATSRVITELGARYAEHSEECLCILARLKELGPLGQVTYAISAALAHGDHGALEYNMSCLRLLVDVPIANKGTIDNIGWILFPIARDHPAQVWSYLERWILGHELDESVSEHKMFLSTIEHVHRCHPGSSAAVLTRWFSSSDLRLVEEARNVLRELGIEAFDPRVIKSSTPQTIVYVTEKLLVGRLGSTQMLRLLGSILLKTGHMTELREYFSRVLRYLAWNLPGGYEQFFEQVIKESESEARSLVQIAHQELMEYQGARGGVFVSELTPSQRRVHRYQELEAKQMEEAYQKAQSSDRFPFQKFLSRVMIGRGDRTFHMNIYHPDPASRRTFTEPRGFGQISESIELPRGEFLDPEGEVWQRVQRMKMKPDDILIEGS
jgi:hypothetical protein